ncbi:potassium channel family protein [Crenobacter sp. SG2303]|uniref:Potassium channel family protein n=1 Tax=Crenobacter oryzisoli TaxID=3056844 RepID=A0ABT7XT79_9NEIS|nr:potassium channel family protein [Crenobacter sp. SG2303]MDN0077009.1 potassium channel family protein [Crenobacter sp. SG2303]
MLAALLFGTSGYMMVEGWSFSDSLFMTVITLATIGYGETHKLSLAGRYFTIALIVFGTGVVGYGISSLTLMLFQGDLPLYLRRRKMEKLIAQMSQHTIICGLSRTGRYALEELLSAHHQVVVIEKSEANVALLQERGIPYIVGDATEDENLTAAGIARAQALISCLSSDADNAFVVVTAKSLNAAVMVVAKAENESSRKKLKAVGADNVVIPSHLGGMNMANIVAHPETHHFFEHLHHRYPNQFRAQIHVLDERWEGQSLARFLQDSFAGKAMVVALEHSPGEVEFAPGMEVLLHAGESILLISTQVSAT